MFKFSEIGEKIDKFNETAGDKLEMAGEAIKGATSKVTSKVREGIDKIDDKLHEHKD